ncbi:MAG: 2-amino-4-hydroxy-6-hydroxymethyldihydropteridine diphosphokinase [Cytophagales bacterium]|nr:2-amino-4-hydroxy-6-hydroxymethyldihydropteridine diphosphokinase [Cytophagales bacterium]
MSTEPHPHEAYLGVGSNVGNKIENITRSLAFISEQVGNIATKSSLYRSEPWGNRDQDSFINIVIKITTAQSCETLLKTLLNIEDKMGRVRTEKWGPRTIDIDILYYDNLILDMDYLTIPHIELPYRRFVLTPLVEIAPHFMHPFFKLTNEELLQECDDNLTVTALQNVY